MVNEVFVSFGVKFNSWLDIRFGISSHEWHESGVKYFLLTMMLLRNGLSATSVIGI